MEGLVLTKELCHLFGVTRAASLFDRLRERMVDSLSFYLPNSNAPLTPLAKP